MARYSFWEEEAFLPPVDVTIAGAGFAGLWTAWHLLQIRPKLRVRILEKNLVPSGASTRNAGFACFGSLTELIADAKAVGEKAMQEMVSMRWEGLQMLTSLLNHQNFDYTQDGGYELIPEGKFASTIQLESEMEKVNDLLEEVIGKSRVFSIASNQLKDYGFAGTEHLIANALEGQLHPGKMVGLLISRLQILGVDIKFGVEVVEYFMEKDSVTIETNLGSINSRQLIICTNAFSPGLTADPAVTPARGQMLLTAPLPGLRFKGCFHADEGFIYFRDLGDRVLLGGARNTSFEAEQTLETGITRVVQQELERYLSQVILPGNDVQIERRWSGIMGMSASRLPVVKQLEPGVFSAVAMGGIGVAVGPVIGRQAAELMTSFC